MNQKTELFFRDMSRRRFLLSSSLFAITIPNSLSAQALSSDMEQTWLKLADTFLPKKDIYQPQQQEFLHSLSTIISHLPADVKPTLETFLVLFDKAAIILGWHWSSFKNLTREQAVSYCHRWENGYQWQILAFKGLKEIVYTAYWSLPQTWPFVDYPGPVSEEQNIPSLGNSPLPQHHTPSSEKSL